MTVRVLNGVVLFGADTARSRAYLDLMRQAGLSPAACVVVSPPATGKSNQPAETDLFDNLTPLAEAARQTGVEVTEVVDVDINGSDAVAALAGCSQQIVIFSGPPGALVREPLFATGKSFLHIHPGRLPSYRGSTTMYYSLLAEGEIWASALILDPRIDCGPVVDEMEGEVPTDPTLLDGIYDPVIRARLLVRVLERYHKTGQLSSQPQPVADKPAYFIVHPVLKHIAMLSVTQKTT